MSDRDWYVGKSLDELKTAQNCLGNLAYEIDTLLTTNRLRHEHTLIAEHDAIMAALSTAADETKAAIAMIQDVIDSGDSAESIIEAEDQRRLAAATRARQV